MCPATIPPDLGVFTNVEIWNVGLDIKQGCAIQHVNAFDIEAVAIHVEKTHQRKTNGIGAAGITGGKDAMCLVIQKGLDAQIITLRAGDQVQ